MVCFLQCTARRQPIAFLAPSIPPQGNLMTEAYVLPFDQLRMQDVGSVGGKNASLGEMINQLSHLGIRVPGGFATTAAAYRDFLAQDGLAGRIDEALKSFD